MHIRERIRTFLEHGPYAVVGASANREKYGNKVLRAYLQQGQTVYPINPHETEVEGLRCYPDFFSLPEPVDRASVITPPAVTEQIVEQAAQAGVRYLWLQPGAESRQALSRAQELGLEMISGGACALVAMGYHE